MAEAVGAARGERVEGRMSYRSGYYARSLITRVGKLELRIPLRLRFATGKSFTVDGLREKYCCYFKCPETCFVISNMVTCFLPPKTALRASSALMSVFFFAS